MVRGLRPDDPPAWMRDELAADTRDLMLVGHMPHLDALARMLAQELIEFPLHGARWRSSGPRTDGPFDRCASMSRV
jgi:phosphohistidine phosphatase SixA